MHVFSRNTMGICAALLLGSAATHAQPIEKVPVTLELLSELRAEKAKSRPSTRIHGPGPTIALEDVEVFDGVLWTDVVGWLREAYGVPTCVEYEPDSGEGPPLPFQIHQDQRLVDALDGLEKASGGQVVWRLLEGRIVLTGHGPAVAEGAATLDQDVVLDLRADSLSEALRGLETVFNEHHDAMPIIVSTICLDFKPDTVGFPRAEGGTFRLAGRMKMRDALIATLAATGDPWMTYSMSRTRGGDRVDSYLWIKVQTRPCRDAFEAIEEQDAVVQAFHARGARGETYQAAIDARRAAREAAVEEPRIDALEHE